jgi:hypothetical protein
MGGSAGTVRKQQQVAGDRQDQQQLMGNLAAAPVVPLLTLLHLKVLLQVQVRVLVLGGPSGNGSLEHQQQLQQMVQTRFKVATSISSSLLGAEVGGVEVAGVLMAGLQLLLQTLAGHLLLPWTLRLQGLLLLLPPLTLQLGPVGGSLAAGMRPASSSSSSAGSVVGTVAAAAAALA